jgi:arylformamidase
MSNHAGTHIDYPAHFIAGGKTSDHFPLSYLRGTCIVTEVPEGIKLITLDHVPPDITEGDIVFFKTTNSNLTKYSPEYVTLAIETAEALKDNRVKIVGIDYLSVDTADSSEFPIHHILLGAEILIVENLKLKEVPPGRYHARIYPLQLAGIDGAPATVSLEI